MPELPEVQTTATGLDRRIRDMTIIDVWTDYRSPFHVGKDNIKDPAYFAQFKKTIVGTRIASVGRIAKNVLIRLNTGGTILIHMKMTGHLILGRYDFHANKARGTDANAGSWTPTQNERPALFDPFNRFIHFVLTLSDSNKKKAASARQLVLSDMRKFAKITLIPKENISHGGHLDNIGPDPLDKKFDAKAFKDRLTLRPNGKIKQVLMDQSIIAGIGNIYSDEALWRAGIHPEERVHDISDQSITKLYTATRFVLEKGIDFGGDSMSDYRNIDGERGAFQAEHRAYRKTGAKCSFTTRKNGKTVRCQGTIRRKMVGGRSAHFCDTHQKLIHAHP